MFLECWIITLARNMVVVAFFGHLGASWTRLGASEAYLGASWGRLGSVLGRQETKKDPRENPYLLQTPFWTPKVYQEAPQEVPRSAQDASKSTLGESFWSVHAT